MPKPIDPSALHHPLPNPSPVEGEGLSPAQLPSPLEGEGPGERGIQDLDGLEAEFASAIIACEALIDALCEAAESARALAGALIQSGRADRALMIEQEYSYARKH